jgi:hypothetical protein
MALLRPSNTRVGQGSANYYGREENIQCNIEETHRESLRDSAGKERSKPANARGALCPTDRITPKKVLDKNKPEDTHFCFAKNRTFSFCLDSQKITI